MSDTEDPFTMSMRLCVADGRVSHAPIREDTPTTDASYLARLNRLRNLTREGRGDKPETITTPFACTGHAHLVGQHIRCTSSAHYVRDRA